MPYDLLPLSGIVSSGEEEIELLLNLSPSSLFSTIGEKGIDPRIEEGQSK